MRLGKTVLAEALDLAEDPRREGLVIATRAHARQQSLLEVTEPAMAFPSRHGAAQLVGLTGREAGCDDGDLHHLFLEDRYAERALQHRLHRLARIVDRFFAPAPAQVRMDHIALDGSRPYDRHLDHEVVEVARPQPRQHRLLRARLDLEHPDGVGAADHIVDRRVLRGDGAERERCATPHRAPLRHQIERAADGAQHAEREHIDLEESERIEIVFVPLDDGAIRHRRVLHRHQLLEAVARDHEAADMLRQVAREPEQLLRELEQLREAAYGTGVAGLVSVARHAGLA